MPQPRIDPLARIDTSGDCWLWTGPVDKTGYGRAGRRASSHRAVYELLVGPIPPEMDLDHLCHGWDKSCPGGKRCVHRRCVNPDHLEPVTHAENVLRGKGLAAQNAAKTECVNGHPFSPENTYLRVRQPGRDCRQCIRDAGRRYYQRKAAAR